MTKKLERKIMERRAELKISFEKGNISINDFNIKLTSNERHEIVTEPLYVPHMKTIYGLKILSIK